jgi:very-short-patch-repair endonuclease
VRRPTDRRRARADGITDWHLRHRDVERLSRDTYLPRAVSADLDQRVAAVLLGAPSTAVVSHLSAAALWDLEIPLVPEDPRVHLTVPSTTRVRQRADRRVHFCDVPPASVMRRRGFLLTSPGRTWLDLAAVVPPAALLAVADQMLAREYPRSWFDRYLDQAQGARGVRAARRVAVLADRRSGSPMESVLRWLLEDAGLPAPVLQHTVLDRAGRFVGTVDLAWPRARLLVEFDGNVHRERDVFVKDLRRQNGLVLAGWTVLRFSSADVRGRPETVLAAIRSALASR